MGRCPPPTLWQHLDNLGPHMFTKNRCTREYRYTHPHSRVRILRHGDRWIANVYVCMYVYIYIYTLLYIYVLHVCTQKKQMQDTSQIQRCKRYCGNSGNPQQPVPGTVRGHLTQGLGSPHYPPWVVDVFSARHLTRGKLLHGNGQDRNLHAASGPNVPSPQSGKLRFRFDWRNSAGEGLLENAAEAFSWWFSEGGVYEGYTRLEGSVYWARRK